MTGRSKRGVAFDLPVICTDCGNEITITKEEENEGKMSSFNDCTLAALISINQAVPLDLNELIVPSFV
jgi:hypothetical protein